MCVLYEPDKQGVFCEIHKIQADTCWTCYVAIIPYNLLF